MYQVAAFGPNDSHQRHAAWSTPRTVDDICTVILSSYQEKACSLQKNLFEVAQKRGNAATSLVNQRAHKARGTFTLVLSVKETSFEMSRDWKLESEDGKMFSRTAEKKALSYRQNTLDVMIAAKQAEVNWFSKTYLANNIWLPHVLERVLVVFTNI